MGKEIDRTTFVQEINSSKLFSTGNQVSFRSKVFCNKGNIDPSLQNNLRSKAYVYTYVYANTNSKISWNSHHKHSKRASMESVMCRRQDWLSFCLNMPCLSKSFYDMIFNNLWRCVDPVLHVTQRFTKF